MTPRAITATLAASALAWLILIAAFGRPPSAPRTSPGGAATPAGRDAVSATGGLLFGGVQHGGASRP